VSFLAKRGEATVDEIGDAVGIGRTSTRKYLAGLERDHEVIRKPGGREGRRKLPDRFSIGDQRRAGHAPARQRPSANAKANRLHPGELDELVLAYMCKQEQDWPLTASAVSRGIERSSGAVANCLARLTEKQKARLVQEKPRAYELRKASPAR
jgi:hypothetical protein